MYRQIVSKEIDRLININNCRSTKALELLPIKINVSKAKLENTTYKSNIVVGLLVNNEYVNVYEKDITARSIRTLKAKIKIWLSRQVQNILEKLDID